MAKHISTFGGFSDFVRKQGVVGLAVGLAIGAQAAVFVNAIVANLITPLVNLVVGKEGLDGLDLYIKVSDRTAVFEFGTVLDALIKFLAVAAVIYFVVIKLKLDKLDKKKDDISAA